MAPKKPGRQPKPPTDVEQAEIDGRTELTHQWITSTFACTISAIQHNKRGKSVAGQYYLAQLQDRLCFNKAPQKFKNSKVFEEAKNTGTEQEKAKAKVLSR